MLPLRESEQTSELESLTREGVRRHRPGADIESQPARCPICNKVMVLYMSARGPKFHCGCAEVNGHNGAGHH